MYRFYTGLVAPKVPRGVHVMNPYADARARRFLRAFGEKYFADNRERVLVFGINPGRFGAGITGVTFADPVVLADVCGIPNDLPRRRELSSIFIFDFIDKFGGPEKIYRDCFITAISPLGFTRAGKNLNYYDERPLERAMTPFIVRTIEQQIAMGGRRDHAVVLGMGANHRFFRKLNEKHGFFEQIHALEHPRFILQYRRKRVGEYLTKYCETFARLTG
jgi:hypothetical protein